MPLGEETSFGNDRLPSQAIDLLFIHCEFDPAFYQHHVHMEI